MKVIRVEIPAKTDVSYQCETCGRKYHNELSAVNCEKRKLERKIFKIGELVKNTTARQCHNGKNYYFDGTVIDIRGPIPSDDEYEILILGGKEERMNSHVYQYEVKYVCPICKKIKTALLYSPQLKSTEIVKNVMVPHKNKFAR